MHKSSQPNMKSKNLAAEIVIAYFIYIFVALLKLLSRKWLFTSWEKSSGKVFYKVSLKHKCWNLVKITQISFVDLKLIFIACLKYDSYCIYIIFSLSICLRVTGNQECIQNHSLWKITFMVSNITLALFFSLFFR